MPKRTIGSLLLLAACLLFVGVFPEPVGAQDPSQHAETESESDHYRHGFENPEQYADDWNDPARDDWQKPDAIIQAMGLDAGMTVADLGTGTGYFVPHLADAVKETGRVLAVDLEPNMLDYVAAMAQEKGLGSVDTVRAQPTDTGLDESSVDRILTVNTWHHIPDRGDYAAHLAGRLTEGGSVWVIDFTADAPMGPPKKHRLAPQTVVDELEQGGFDAEVRDLGLPNQYVVVGHLE